MAVSSKVVTVGTAPTALNTVGLVGQSPPAITVTLPAGSVTVYFGGPNVTADVSATTGGTQLSAGQKFNAWGLLPGEVVYAIVAAGTQAVQVVSSGV